MVFSGKCKRIFLQKNVIFLGENAIKFFTGETGLGALVAPVSITLSRKCILVEIIEGGRCYISLNDIDDDQFFEIFAQPRENFK